MLPRAWLSLDTRAYRAAVTLPTLSPPLRQVPWPKPQGRAAPGCKLPAVSDGSGSEAGCHGAQLGILVLPGVVHPIREEPTEPGDDQKSSSLVKRMARPTAARTRGVRPLLTGQCRRRIPSPSWAAILETGLYCWAGRARISLPCGLPGAMGYAVYQGADRPADSAATGAKT